MKHLSTLTIVVSLLLSATAFAQDESWSTLGASDGSASASDDAADRLEDALAGKPMRAAKKPVVVEPSPDLLPAAHAMCETGRATLTRKDDGYLIGCDGCPESSDAHHGSLGLQRAYVGSFSGPDAEEMLLATTGCGGGFNFRNSAVLLRKKDGKWHRIEWKNSFFANRCTPMASGDNASLLCLHSEAGGGSSYTYINWVSADDDGIEFVTLAEMKSGRGGCYYTPKFTDDGIFERELDDVVIEDIDDDGRVEIAILYTAHHAEVLQEPARGERCEESNYNFTSEPKAHVFEVEGHRYREDPGELDDIESKKVREHL